MVSKLSQLDENEYVLTEKIDTYIYQEIAKYLTIHDIQLIVSSLEALYQLSELGEATSGKIAEVSSTVGKTLIEPCHDKTGLRGFRSGPIQTGLCIHRR